MVLGKREQPYFDGVIESFIDNKMEYELYNPDELKRKFSNLTMANDEWGCFDPAGGVLLADKCLKSSVNKGESSMRPKMIGLSRMP